MDRRTFLRGAGGAGAMGALAGGLAVRDAVLRSEDPRARAEALARPDAAYPKGSGGVASVRAAASATTDGLTLGFLPGSTRMLGHAGGPSEGLIGAHFVAWDASMASVTSAAEADRRASLVTVHLGALQRAGAPSAPGVLDLLDVVAHHAIDRAPYVADFVAWQYKAGSRVATSSAARFVASLPDGLVLTATYGLRPGRYASGIGGAGSLRLPVLSSSGGLPAGLYVLAAPTSVAGTPPDLNACAYTGHLGTPLATPTGAAPDFDYVALAIQRGAA